MTTKVKVVLGKSDGSVKAPADSLLKKNSILFRLPYWQFLIVRHALDGMHITKNVCESLLGLLMGSKVGTAKDGLDTRLDMQLLNMRPELHPVVQPDGSKKLPVATWTLGKQEKVKLISFFHQLKVPTGYCGNLKRLVNMTELKFNMGCMKAHDCHVFMTQLLPVALRGVLMDKVRDPLIKLCAFFNAISHKVMDPTTLDKLHADLVHTLSRLEMHLPMTFWNISPHLLIHLVDQIKALGPMFLHNMFPFERLMSVLRKYVRNRYRPEGCMVQGWSTEEAIEFCTYYLDLDRIGVPVSRHEGRLAGKGTIGHKRGHVDDLEAIKQAHFTVLLNATSVFDYHDMHKEELRAAHVGWSEAYVAKQHRLRFGEWLQVKLTGVQTEDPQLSLLSMGPSATVSRYEAYEINGYTFYTRRQDAKSVNQNSGVKMQVINSNQEEEVYYGFIEEIWELTYGPITTPLFKCQWIRVPTGVTIDKYGMVVVDLKNTAYRDEPFVLASAVAQVFYAPDLSDATKHVALQGKRKIVGVEGRTEEEGGFQDMPPLGPDIELPVFEEGREPAYVRTDHDEAIIVK